MKKRHARNYRLTEAALQDLDYCAGFTGLTKTSAIIMALRIFRILCEKQMLPQVDVIDLAELH